ncbi:rna-dependent dna polymerase [Lasius niger]|uniref:Rna-dependent dna polymerase n=1 Tax=Lasius niger TaxID=67767 RepID=A0A0J7KFR5_LASNI|nr:rna-dependent dna polymerase [Lasius niger]
MLKEVYGRGITKFNDSDLTWKFEVTQMLMAHGLDNLIDDSRPRLVGERNISAVKAWVKDNAKAMSLYLQHLKERGAAYFTMIKRSECYLSYKGRSKNVDGRREVRCACDYEWFVQEAKLKRFEKQTRRLYDPKTRKIMIFRDITFNEATKEIGDLAEDDNNKVCIQLPTEDHCLIDDSRQENNSNYEEAEDEEAQEETKKRSNSLVKIGNQNTNPTVLMRVSLSRWNRKCSEIVIHFIVHPDIKQTMYSMIHL